MFDHTSYVDALLALAALCSLARPKAPKPDLTKLTARGKQRH
jgi:hypothetical protein